MSVCFTYTNWKGETNERHVRPDTIFFGSTPHHPVTQWFLIAWDVDKRDTRTFALRNIRDWRPAWADAADTCDGAA